MGDRGEAAGADVAFRPLSPARTHRTGMATDPAVDRDLRSSDIHQAPDGRQLLVRALVIASCGLLAFLVVTNLTCALAEHGQTSDQAASRRGWLPSACKSWKLVPTSLVTLLIRGRSATQPTCSADCLHRRLVLSCSTATSIAEVSSCRDEPGWPSTFLDGRRSVVRRADVPPARHAQARRIQLRCVHTAVIPTRWSGRGWELAARPASRCRS